MGILTSVSMLLKLIRYIYSQKYKTGELWRREAHRDKKELPRAVDNERDGQKCMFFLVSRFAVKGNFRLCRDARLSTFWDGSKTAWSEPSGYTR